MSTNQNRIGQKGESIACDYLLSQGYSILENNWRFSKAEIDIIAMKDGVLVFVEVKTKSYTYFGRPEESVTPLKEALYFDAANVYMEKIEHEGEIRFDIIGVLLASEEKPTLDHFEDAFFPGI